VWEAIPKFKEGPAGAPKMALPTSLPARNLKRDGDALKYAESPPPSLGDDGVGDWI
jgi:hypothetical protein